ncbi:hypothetical protein [Anthocerotibacter panamensis]|uniref:hypothetical protein n=1 Tax=Anthocerotibacter panamensis TaxID=2857077 RepID=UPI001C4074D1|nr:hypothetical protein [Anthocerotibacter panamensis]
MTYTNPESTTPEHTMAEAPPVRGWPAGYRDAISRDKVQWGPIFAGLVIALGSQLLLSSLGAALGLSSLATPRAQAPGVGTAVGIWSLLSVFISLFIGGWFVSHLSGPLTRNNALLHGAVLWATSVALGSYLLANGVAGAFGIAAQPRATLLGPLSQLSAEEARELAGDAARAGWIFALASLAGLGASLFGAATGERLEETR